MDTFARGTFRSNRKHYPKQILCNEKVMNVGDSDFAMAKGSDISLSKWRDWGKKPLVAVSSFHDPSKSIQVLRTNKTGILEPVQCPNSIADYNSFTEGVDLFDQLLSSYCNSWKSRCWWMKILYFLADASIVNSYILYEITACMKNRKPMSHLQFRDLWKITLDERKLTLLQLWLRTKRKMEHIQRSTNVGTHLPIQVEKYKSCAYCSTKVKVKRSRLVCKACDVALCRACFEPFHK